MFFISSLTITTSWSLPYLPILKKNRQGCWTWHIVLVNYNIKSYDFPSRLGSCGIAVFQGWSAEFCGICTLKYAVPLACFCLHMCLDNTLNMWP